MTTHLQKQLDQRMALERKVVRHLIRTAKKHDYAVTKVWDGGEGVKCRTETEAMNAVFSVDESTIYFKHPDQLRNHCAVIVLGNDGFDSIADNSQGLLWDDVIKECDAYSDKLCDLTAQFLVVKFHDV